MCYLQLLLLQKRQDVCTLNELWPVALIHANVRDKFLLIKFVIYLMRAFGNTYSLFICSTCSMLTMPAMLKFSLYWLILIDSSHSDTDLKGEPSEPLVLGSRIETLRQTQEKVSRPHQDKVFCVCVSLFLLQQKGFERKNLFVRSQNLIKLLLA